MAKTYEQEFIALLSNLFEKSHDVITRVKQSEINFYEADTEDDIERKFTNAVRHYKVYFESELRMWATIPYYFACKVYKIDSKASSPESYVNISASRKYQTSCLCESKNTSSWQPKIC